MQNRSLAIHILPSGDVRVILVVTFGFAGSNETTIDIGIAGLRLVLFAEVTTTGFFARKSIVAHGFTKLEEVGHTPCFFQFHVRIVARTWNAHVAPELLTDFRNAFDVVLQTGFVAGHAAVVPHQQAELAMEGIDSAFAIDVDQTIHALFRFGFGLTEGVVIHTHRSRRLRREIVGNRGRNDKVAISQTLHQRRGAQAVRSVVREIGFAQDMQAGDVRHQIVVHPQTTHGVVHGRVNHHRILVGILASDFFIHLEQVAVARTNHGLAETFRGIAEIEIHAKTRSGHSTTFIASFLGSA